MNTLPFRAIIGAHTLPQGVALGWYLVGLTGRLFRPSFQAVFIRTARNLFGKSGVYFILFANFAMSFNFLLLLNCTTKVSEIFDMAKSLAINCYPGTYK